MLAFTETQKLKCNPVLVATVAGIMIHPSWLVMVNTEEIIQFFNVIPFTLMNYASSIIPIVLVILVQARVKLVVSILIKNKRDKSLSIFQWRHRSDWHYRASVVRRQSAEEISSDRRNDWRRTVVASMLA